MRSKAKSIIANQKPRGKQGRFISDRQPTFSEIGEEMLIGLGPMFGLLLLAVMIVVH